MAQTNSEPDVSGSASTASGQRLARLFQLIHMIQSEPALTAGALADRMRVSRRTLYRDVRTLQEGGVPIVHSLEGGYAISRDYALTDLNLTVSELLGLLLLGKVAETMPDQPLFKPAVDAVERIIAQVPLPVRMVYKNLLKRVTMAPADMVLSNDLDDRYRLLQRCIDERRVCQVRYVGVGPQPELVARIRPLHLHFYRRAWYLFAQRDGSDDVRPYRLSRFRDVVACNDRFPPVGFLIDDYLDDAWGIMPDGRKHNVELEFTPCVAPSVAEVRWHRTQHVEMKPDGSCIMHFRVNGLHELKWWIVGYGSEVRVRKPKELRDEIKRIVRGMVRRYELNEPEAHSVVTAGCEIHAKRPTHPSKSPV
jgi:proteasome accessory factor B